MKRLILLLGVAFASAAVTYFLVGLTQSIDRPAGPGSDLAWIRVEFGLNDDEFAAVRQLHADYSGPCARHCADIVAAHSRLAGLSQAGAAPDERAAAEKRVVELEAICNEATRAHLWRVAAAMPTAQGERFLRMVEPHLAQLPHDGMRGMGR